MNPYRKELMHRVMNSYLALTPIMHQLSRYRDCDKILKWLILNRITGQNLLDFVKINHGNSIMSMVKFIVKCNNKEREERAIILGKDWIK